MNYITASLIVYLRSTFKGFGCTNALYVFALALLFGPAQVCSAQSSQKEIDINVLTSFLYTQDPHFINAIKRLPEVSDALDGLKAAVITARTRRPGQFTSEFENCLKAIDTAIRRADFAIKKKDYGSVEDLVSADPAADGPRTKITACLTTLNSGMGRDSDIEAATNKLNAILSAMDAEMEQIDEAAAAKKAAKEYERIETQDNCGNTNSQEITKFQRENYKVKDLRVENPFDFLPWVKIKVDSVKTKIKELLVRDSFDFIYETAVGEALTIIENEKFLSDTSDAPCQFAVEVVTVEYCTSKKEINLVYRIYSTQILPVLSGTPESRVTERQTPQNTAGMTESNSPTFLPVRLIPTAGYDSTNKLFGGGRLEINPQQLKKLHFNSFIVEGQGSNQLQTISAALAGSADSKGWLAHSEWRLNYSHYSLPTGAGNLDGGHLSAQFSGMTRPFWGGNFTARFGGLLEGGNRQSELQNTKLSPDTLASAGFGAFKLYLGLDSRIPHNVVSLSYGLALGSVDSAARVDWRKQIGDVKHEFWYPLGDHRILSLESRLTFGGIQVPQKIPLSERFFGGANEQLFIADDTWKIRANPVIRAIPGSRFFQTADGAGADSFVSYNLTAAYALWRKSLVPAELMREPGFKGQVDSSITSATSILSNHFASEDRHYGKVSAELPALQGALNDLMKAVTDAQTARPGQFEAMFKACKKAINTAVRRTKSAIQSNGLKQYSVVVDLLNINPVDPNEPNEEGLEFVVKACLTDLNEVLSRDAAIAASGNSLKSLGQKMKDEFNLIDQVKATAQAKAMMAFPRRTLNTIFNDVNIYSVSPVFVFDIAKIGPKTAGFDGVRYGPGVGLRLEFASMAHFTVGYAWNVKQRPGEGAGTVFFSIGVRDLFH